MGKSGGVTHDFAECLSRSHSYSEAPWWNVVYRRAFPRFKASVNVRQDGWAQRGGIDRVITLGCGRTITVDEKVREKDYGDVLLERWSDRDKRVPGWVQKPLACDYIAYAIVPTEQCYLLPVMILQRAWRLNGKDWIARYPEIVAANNGYVTLSIGIPKDVLFSALTGAMTIYWGKDLRAE